ncbi:molybdopterin cofactor-binding domain-containing protein, partial [Arthrospira platensis SPKY1]|nr:molybdopterin cofactor-binding domain-containing protein [Arthrospira platensis SPKY1]
ECIGQCIVLIAGNSEEAVNEAARLVEIDYEPLDPVLTIEQAVEKDSRLAPTRSIRSGNVEDGFRNSSHILEGTVRTGAQEHWYLEPQTALCVPQEDGDMLVYASSQNPTETQMIVAEVLGLEAKNVVCEVK